MWPNPDGRTPTRSSAREEVDVPISVRSIERELRQRLDAAGRHDLATRAVERIALTDDGSTVYVHIIMRPDWQHFRPGDVYPLAFADYPDLKTLTQWLDFLRQ